MHGRPPAGPTSAAAPTTPCWTWPWGTTASIGWRARSAAGVPSQGSTPARGSAHQAGLMVDRFRGPTDSPGNRMDWERPGAFKGLADRPRPGEEACREPSEALGASSAGIPGLLRMFDNSNGGQIGWLLPFALGGGLVALWSWRRDSRRRAFAALFLGWIALYGGIYSYAQGIIPRLLHVDDGTWCRSPGRRWKRHRGKRRATRPRMVDRCYRACRRHRVGAASDSGAHARLLRLGSPANRGDRLRWGRHGGRPSGPAPPRSQRASPERRGAPAVARGVVVERIGEPPLSMPRCPRLGRNRVHPGGRLAPKPSTTARLELAAWLESHSDADATWQLVVSSSQDASTLIAEYRVSVMALGGFMGTDDAITVARFADLVSTGAVRYVLVGGGFGNAFGRAFGRAFGTSGPNAVMSAVQNACTLVSDSSLPSRYQSVLYDCAGAADAIHSAGGN